MAKVLALRIKPLLSNYISKENFGILENRNIHEVVEATQETFHSIKTKNMNAFIIKIYLEKSYDKSLLYFSSFSFYSCRFLLSLNEVLVAWGRLGIHWYFAATKTPRSPALSVAGRETAYRLTQSDLWGEWKTLVFPLGATLGSLLRTCSILLRGLYFATYILTL